MIKNINMQHHSGFWWSAGFTICSSVREYFARETAELETAKVVSSTKLLDYTTKINSEEAKALE